MRVAWFTPWPPQSSGIASTSVAATRLLAARGFGIDIVVDERRTAAPERLDHGAVEDGVVRVLAAHDFVWRHGRGQYDLVVYQVGNSRHHDYMWAYLFQWPGLVVLHDARLHHARARRLLKTGGAAEYRSEFAYDHPSAPPDAAELAVHGFDGRYYAMWPMTRAVIESARAVAVHARGVERQLTEAYPHRPISYLPLGLGSTAPLSGERRGGVRRQYGASEGDVVFGVFGGLTLDKRVPEIVRAFAATRRRHRHVRLWLAGRIDAALDLETRLRSEGVGGSVQDLGILEDRAFEEAIGAVDVSLNLRWPTALETSGPWLQALSLARPTVVIELAHQTDVPAVDPRDWRPRNPADRRQPAAVAVDILDEHHSLVLAMERLAGDPRLREDLGRAARAYWEAEHTPERSTEGYRAVLADAATRPAPSVALPGSLRPDVWAHTRDLMTSFGLDRCALR